MKAVLAWFLGIGRGVWMVLGPWLRSETVRVISDPTVHALIIKAVEAAAKTDLDGDGKYQYARAQLERDLRNLGREYRDGILRQGIEIVLDMVKAKAKG